MRFCTASLLAVLLVGCTEEPPGNLRVADTDPGFGPPDSVQIRLLGRERGLGGIWWGRLDSTEQAWLQNRGYQLARRHVDSTATHYFRNRASRWPHWDDQTLMTEWLYVRSTPQNRGMQAEGALAAVPEPLSGWADPSTPRSETTGPDAPHPTETRSRASRTKEQERGGSAPQVESPSSSPSAGRDGPPAQRHEVAQWGIVVGSMTDPSSALTLLKTYKKRLSTLDLPVHLRTGSRRDTVRYRVVVGKFDSVAVRRALEQHRSTLPAGAWPLRFR